MRTKPGRAADTVTAKPTRRLTLLATVSLGLLMTCLLAPAVAIVAVIKPMAYPNAIFVRMRLPSVATLWNGSCVRTTFVSRLNYESPDQPLEVLHWYQAQGWLINFRYGDSVLRQTGKDFGAVEVNSVREIYVDKPGSVTLIATAMQYTVSVGICG